MKSSSEVPERVAIVGNMGTGKTEAWVAWAQWLRETETPGTVYVLNAERDGSVQRANERFPEWRSNITFTDVNGWLELTTASKLYTGMAGDGDLIVVDGSDKPWNWVRDLYSETEARKKGFTLDETDPFAMLPEIDMDWDAINTAYYRWFNGLIGGTQPAHVMFVGPSQPLRVPVQKKDGSMTWGDDKQTLDLFNMHGVRWAGQKRLGFDVQTLLLAEVSRTGHTLTTMKDAGGRPYMSKETVSPMELGGFVQTYLVGKAGWSL